uniref:Uncharacterized protein n=1 Tax=Myoviridae sp. ctRci5 TaxID=2825105 RepID=A0A8S5V6T9_9CAUD|nr:MAG TPA: hypothetical protein [Myoviridae sp. ctRci5]
MAARITKSIRLNRGLNMKNSDTTSALIPNTTGNAQRKGAPIVKKIRKSINILTTASACSTLLFVLVSDNTSVSAATRNVPSAPTTVINPCHEAMRELQNQNRSLRITAIFALLAVIVSTLNIHLLEKEKP